MRDAVFSFSAASCDSTFGCAACQAENARWRDVNQPSCPCATAAAVETTNATATTHTNLFIACSSASQGPGDAKAGEAAAVLGVWCCVAVGGANEGGTMRPRRPARE